MGNLVYWFTRSWDCGYDISYHGIVWDFKTMQPKEISLKGKPTETEIDSKSIAARCYAAYIHNENQILIIRESEYATLIPGEVMSGDVVKVVRGRKVPIGITGTVKYLYQTNYGPKVCITLSNNTEVRVYSRNLEVLANSLTRRPIGLDKFKDVTLGLSPLELLLC